VKKHRGTLLDQPCSTVGA